jgi:hypothetical protein
MKPRIRPKLAKPAAAPPDDLFPTPDALTTGVPGKRRKTAQARTRDKAAVPAEQPFLPGLSRRGRPRLQHAVPATERAAESRRKRVEAGAKRIEIMLAPEVAAGLDALAEHFNESRAAVLGRLVARAAKRVLK